MKRTWSGRKIVRGGLLVGRRFSTLARGKCGGETNPDEENPQMLIVRATSPNLVAIVLLAVAGAESTDVMACVQREERCRSDLPGLREDDSVTHQRRAEPHVIIIRMLPYQRPIARAEHIECADGTHIHHALVNDDRGSTRVVSEIDVPYLVARASVERNHGGSSSHVERALIDGQNRLWKITQG